MKTVEKILLNHPKANRSSLIPILQEVQKAENYLSKESIEAIAHHLGIPTSKVYGAATFYNQFRFQPLGKYHIQLCRGTACHVLGSATILESLERRLGIKSSETTRDGLFTLEVVACIGACGLAPVMSINGEFHAKLTPEKIDKIIENIRMEEKKNGNQ